MRQYGHSKSIGFTLLELLIGLVIDVTREDELFPKISERMGFNLIIQ